MTMTITLSSAVMAKLKENARLAGEEVSDYVEGVILRAISPVGELPTPKAAFDLEQRVNGKMLELALALLKLRLRRD